MDKYEEEHHSEDERLFSLFSRISYLQKKNLDVPDDLYNDFLYCLQEIDRLNIRTFKNPMFAQHIPILLEALAVQLPISYHCVMTDGVLVPEDMSCQDYYAIASDQIVDQTDAVYEYFTLIPPYIAEGSIIPKKIKTIYKETRQSHVCGYYNAAISMSRVIIEASLKVVLKKELDDEMDSLKYMLDKALRFKILTPKAWEYGQDIRRMANEVLHGSRLATKKNSMQVIEIARKYIEEVF